MQMILFIIGFAFAIEFIIGGAVALAEKLGALKTPEKPQQPRKA